MSNRFTDGKSVTKQDIADAASEVVRTSQSKILAYSRRTKWAKPDDVVVELRQAD